MRSPILAVIEDSRTSDRLIHPGGPQQWLPTSPDLCPPQFYAYVWVHTKNMVYEQRRTGDKVWMQQSFSTISLMQAIRISHSADIMWNDVFRVTAGCLEHSFRNRKF